MATWLITATANGGHHVVRVDDDANEEQVVGEHAPEVTVQAVIEIVLYQADVGDWLLTPSGEPLLVAELHDES